MLNLKNQHKTYSRMELTLELEKICVFCSFKTENYCGQCGIFVCRDCNITEKHDGCFRCSVCQFLVCNTYKFDDSNECQNCIITSGVIGLNELAEGLGDATLQALVDAPDEKLSILEQEFAASKIQSDQECLDME